MSAEDWAGLGRVVDRVLEEYIENGACLALSLFAHRLKFAAGPKVFARYAADLAPMLQNIGTLAVAQGVFVHRLVFAVRYSHFHHLCMSQELQNAASDLVAMFIDDVAPKSWWAVMLCDSVELLQHGA